MKARHQISGAAIALIKRFEGFRETAAQLDDGRWTIGYGHTLSARQGARVDEADAEALLLYDLIGVAHAINEWSYAPLNQNQFDALVSFVFNIGIENFRRSATLRWLNEGRLLEAAMAMELWRKADFQGERIVIDALVRRRACEKNLFLRPTDAWPAAPTPVLAPSLDYDTASVMPSQTPSVVTTRIEGDHIVSVRAPATQPPTPPEPETAPTATQAAAAIVSARLGAIFADEPDSPAPAEAPFPDRRLEPAEPAQETEKTPPPAAIPAAAPGPAIDWQSKTRRSSPGLVWLIALALIGAGAFAAAVLWGFKAPGIGAWFGWALGGFGIVSFATAAYLLLARLPDNGPPGG
jgi:lysozyme